MSPETRSIRPLIECFQMKKRSALGDEIFSGANFCIREGECVLLTGADGSGKSTLIRLLFGLEALEEGHILINGRNLQQLKPSETPYFRRRIGVVFQTPQLMTERTVFENVALPLYVSGKSGAFIRKKVYGLLGSMGLERLMAQHCSKLSETERRLVAVARAVAHDPVILLVDEPTANLESRASATILASISEAHAKGSTVLVVASTPDTKARGLPAGRTVTIQRGEIIDKSLSASESSALNGRGLALRGSSS